MDAFGQDPGCQQKMLWERKFLDEAPVRDEGDRGSGHRIDKPGPWKQTRKEKKGEIFALDLEHHGESDEKDEGKQQRIEERPYDPEPCPLILKSGLLFRQHPKEIHLSPEMTMKQSHVSCSPFN